MMQLTFGNMTLELNIFHLCKGYLAQDEDEQEEMCLIDTLIEEHVDGLMNEKLEKIYEELEENEVEEKVEEANKFATINHFMKWKAKEELLPLIKEEKTKKQETPKLNLNPLPNDLKYAYLEGNKYPVSILSHQQEACLLEVLRRCKKAIGWTIYNLKWISPLV